MKIKTRYGEIREGTMQDFWTEHNFILKNGFISKPQEPVNQDRSAAAAHRRLAEDAGQGLAHSLFGVPDRRPLEKKIADAVGDEVRRQLNPSPQASQMEHSRQAQTAHHSRNFGLADAQKRLREDGIRWPGITDQPGKPGKSKSASSAIHGPTAEAVNHARTELSRQPLLAKKLQERPDCFRDPFWQPYLAAASDMKP